MPKECEYGARQPEVIQAMMEALNWLEREGHLIRNPQQPTSDWFNISRSGEKRPATIRPRGTVGEAGRRSSQT